MPRSEIPYVIQNPATGEAVAGALCYVYLRDGVSPTNTLATVYNQETGSATNTLPLTSGTEGQVSGWLEEGSYTLSVTGSGLAPFSAPFESISGKALFSIDGSRITPGTLSGTVFADNSIPSSKIQGAGGGGVGNPPGVILAYAGSTPPSGYLACEGQAVNRTTYAALYAVIGTTYGAGDGSTTFNVPDTRSRVLIGSGPGPSLTNRARGAKGGTENETLALSQIPSHNHTGTVSGSISGITDYQLDGNTYAVAELTYNYGFVGTSRSGWHVANRVHPYGINHAHNFSGSFSSSFTTNSSGSGGAVNNMPPFLATPHIIKT